MSKSVSWKLRVFYDGACPLCSREMAWLMKRIPEGEISFEDISNEQFRYDELGISREALMKEIHAERPNGEIIKGMAVFRELYEVANLGWLLRPTAWPLLRTIADFAYRLFARNRHYLKRC